MYTTRRGSSRRAPHALWAIRPAGRIPAASPSEEQQHAVGVVLQRLGRKASAKKRYERVLELAPTHSAANSNLARLDSSAGGDTSGVLDYAGMSSAFDRHGEVSFDKVVRFEPGQRLSMRLAGAEEGANDEGDNTEQEWRVVRFDEGKSAHIVVREVNAVQKKLDDYGKFESGNKLSYQEFQKYLDSQGIKCDFAKDVTTKIR